MTASNHKPKLRRVEPRRIQYQGQPFIQLHDPLGIADRNILLPEGVAPLLALADGTRDAAGLQASLLLHTGVHVSQEQIQELIDGLDEACLLDNDTYEAAVAAAMARYREADSRPPSHAGAVYPDNRSRLAAALSDYEGRAPDVEPLPASTRITGVVSPHIDYERGWQTYAQLWGRIAGALDDVELAIILGTDHKGGPGALTLTRQSYSSPLGRTLPTDREVVDGLAGVDRRERGPRRGDTPPERALHRAGRRLVPEVHRPSCTHCADTLRLPARGRSRRERGGGVRPPGRRHRLPGGRHPREADAGDSGGRPGARRPGLRRPEPDLGTGKGLAWPRRTPGRLRPSTRATRRASWTYRGPSATPARICGISPIYFALRLLRGSKGESLGYDQCPADSGGGSLVTIVGSILWEDGG